MEVTFILNIQNETTVQRISSQNIEVASTGQHQMVQKFVKELNDSTKQSEQPSNAERSNNRTGRNDRPRNRPW